MRRAKPKTPRVISAPDAEVEPRAIPLPTLDINGVVVSKQSLIEALRVYVPLICDIQPLDGGDRFYLALDARRAGQRS